MSPADHKIVERKEKMSEKQRCRWADSSEEMQKYHDEEYGFPVTDDTVYFERLILELFQAGLSWQTILRKRENFRKAFDYFDFRKIALYSEAERIRLKNDAGIIRNHRKIEATIFNARIFGEIIDKFGSFHQYLIGLPLDNHPEIVKIFRKQFRFMGPLIIEEFMMSTGHWPVQHDPECFLAPINRKPQRGS